ncbi:MAG: two-component regulator propeller domain-containing protein [Chitinophagaceae bacterium]
MQLFFTLAPKYGYKRSALFLVLFVLCNANTATAQTLKEVKNIGIENGLSNNSVTSIYQDKYGFLWIGTYDGINRYNGYNCKVFRHRLNDTTTLINNRITAIAEDNENRLWIGTKKGLCTFSNITQRFSPVYYREASNPAKTESLRNIPVEEVLATQTGEILATPAGKGLMRYNKSNGLLEQVPVLDKNNQQVFSFQAQGLRKDTKGNTWVMVNGHGLGQYDPVKKMIRLINDQLTACSSMEPDGNGNIWIAHIQRLYQYNIGANTVTYCGTASPRGESVLAMYNAGDNMLIGTDGGGIITIEPEHPEKRQPAVLPALSSKCISALYTDKKGNQWIGTLRGGLDCIPNGKKVFASLVHDPRQTNSLVGNFVSAFCQDEQGNMWIGTDGSGISIWDPIHKKFSNFTNENSTLSSNLITSIRKTKDGNIWIGTYGKSVDLYDKKSGRFINYPFINKKAGLYEGNVWNLYEDGQGTLWAGTVTGCLYTFNKHHNAFEVYDEQLKDILCLAEDKQGNLWAGNFESLIRIDQKGRKHTSFDTEAPVRAIREDKNGQLWVATEGNGMLLFNRESGKFESFTEENGLANNSVLNMVEDKNGHLWLSTFNGLSHLDPASRKFNNYFQSDGLQSNQFIYNAAYTAPSGALYLGGIKGLNFFHPDSIALSYDQVPLMITDLRINNQTVAQNNSFTENQVLYTLQSLELPYDKAVLSVDFAAPEFNNPDQILYAYYLEGWDKDWNYCGKIRTAHYSHLREGSYKLHVKSTNAGGLWTNNEKIISITVLPPWYRSWWAWMLYLSIATGILAMYLRFSSQQTKLAWEVKLAHLNAERDQEINRRKLDFFTNIAHEFRTPITLIINPIRDLLQRQGNSLENAGMKMAFRNSKRLLSLVDQLLLFKKADSGADDLRVAKLNLVHVCREVFLCFSQQAKTQELQYSFESAIQELEIYGDREKIEIAIFNLISNAMKFTPAGGSIRIILSEGETEAELCVTDTGCGIPSEESERLFERFYQSKKNGSATKAGFGIGLFLAKSFAEAHKGTLTFTSVPEKGTSFKLTIPKGSAHFIPEQITASPVQQSELLQELSIQEEAVAHPAEKELPPPEAGISTLISSGHSLLVVDDNEGIRTYLKQVFQENFRILEATNGKEGLAMARQYQPDIIISDIVMDEMSGIEFCAAIKEDPTLNHIQLILLTGSSSAEIKLKGVECGADDYITKPFEKELLLARVASLLKSRNNIQKYFYNEVTLQRNNLSISEEYKIFLEKCIEIVEANIDKDDFSIKQFAREMGMSHSNLYKKVKQVSGQSINGFLRFLRLRKAAELLITTDCNVNEAAFQVGIADSKYFRTQFAKLFGMNPSEYRKRYHHAFSKNYQVNEKAVNRL